MIPFASRFGGIDRFARFRVVRRLIKSVEPATTLRISGLGVIFELELGAGRPGCAAIVGHVKHDPAITPF